jgi:hypothetical protein
MTLRRPGIRLELWRDSTPPRWVPLAKHGADLPSPATAAQAARISIGETLDVAGTPKEPGVLGLEAWTVVRGLLWFATLPPRV